MPDRPASETREPSLVEAAFREGHTYFMTDVDVAWAHYRAGLRADGETDELSQIAAAFGSGYTRGWDDREKAPCGFEIERAWADYVRVKGEQP